jgi:hypothetical protein
MAPLSPELPHLTELDLRSGRTVLLASAVVLLGVLSTLIKCSFGGWVALGFSLLGVGLLVMHLVTTVVFSWYLRSWRTFDSGIVLAVMVCCLIFCVFVADGGDAPEWLHWEVLPAREAWCGIYCAAASFAGWVWLILQGAHFLCNIVRIIMQIRSKRS